MQEIVEGRKSFINPHPSDVWDLTSRGGWCGVTDGIWLRGSEPEAKTLVCRELGIFMPKERFLFNVLPGDVVVVPKEERDGLHGLIIRIHDKNIKDPFIEKIIRGLNHEIVSKYQEVMKYRRIEEGAVEARKRKIETAPLVVARESIELAGKIRGPPSDEREKKIRNGDEIL